MAANPYSPQVRSTVPGSSGTAGQPEKPARRFYLRQEELLAGLQAIMDAAQALRHATDQQRRQAELTEAEVDALLVVAVTEATIGQLAKRLGVRPPTLTRTIDGLCTRGYVERSIDRRDKRRRTVKLTQSGQVLITTLTADARSHLAHVYRYLGDDAVAACDQFLAEIISRAGPTARQSTPKDPIQ